MSSSSSSLPLPPVVQLFESKLILPLVSNDETSENLEQEMETWEFNDPEGADRILLVNGKVIYYCHSKILVKKSEFFKTLFEGQFKEKHQQVVPITIPSFPAAEWATATSFEAVMKLMYDDNEEEFRKQVATPIELAVASFVIANYLQSDKVPRQTLCSLWSKLDSSVLFHYKVVDFTLMQRLLQALSETTLKPSASKKPSNPAALQLPSNPAAALKLLLHWGRKSVDTHLITIRRLYLEFRDALFKNVPFDTLKELHGQYPEAFDALPQDVLMHWLTMKQCRRCGVQFPLCAENTPCFSKSYCFSGTTTTEYVKSDSHLLI